MLRVMETDALALLTDFPEYRLLLSAYAAAEALAAEQAAMERASTKATIPAPAAAVEQDGATAERDPEAETRERKLIWVRRLAVVEGVATEQLTTLHGQLIAEGLLQFDLGGREEGVVYRLTREARLALAG